MRFVGQGLHRRRWPRQLLRRTETMINFMITSATPANFIVVLLVFVAVGAIVAAVDAIRS